jgi:hypothetical protein
MSHGLFNNNSHPAGRKRLFQGLGRCLSGAGSTGDPRTPGGESPLKTQALPALLKKTDAARVNRIGNRHLSLLAQTKKIGAGEN